MARPVGTVSKTKDNSRKHPQQNEDFKQGKKIGRPKQVWVPDGPLSGHWEKTR